MIEYIIALFALLSLYNEVTVFLIKRRLKGEIKVKKGMHPFFLKGNKTGILLIHGFTASPHEVSGIGRFLHKKGYTVYAPLLPGHGTAPEMLAVTKWQQWVSSCEEALDVLAHRCNKIWIIGNSMGGNLALLTVNKSKKVKGIVVVSTPMFGGRRYRVLRLLFPIMKRIKLLQKKKYSETFKERVGETRKYAYNTLPLRGVAQLIKLVKESRRNVGKIKKDILVCQANPDEDMDVENGTFIYNTVKSKNKKIMWVPDSMHLVLLDPLQKNKIYKRIFTFIKHGK